MEEENTGEDGTKHYAGPEHSPVGAGGPLARGGVNCLSLMSPYNVASRLAALQCVLVLCVFEHRKLRLG